MNSIEKISIRGYKSIRELENLSLDRLNVLIGANGAGKSNFISFFRLLARLMAGELSYHVAKSGGPDALLHYGRKRTPQMSAEMYFGNNGYKLVLEPTQANTMIFAREAFYWNMGGDFSLGAGHPETKSGSGIQRNIANFVVPSVKSWIVYHFHDTSDSAPMKQAGAVNDNGWLRPDGANLAAYLYRLREQFPEHYRRIVDTIRLVAPFFSDFQLRPNPLDPNSIQLEWNELGSDFPFLGHHLSDGSLRFICLATVLLQPDELMPATILFDEPELGLHPYAIELLASLMHQASVKHQLIVSTQSVELLNQFSPEQIIVVDRENDQSTFNRLDPAKLSVWLDEYSLGEMWKQNMFGGRPS
ncbi:AAA family ATPase [Quatrionicoccus australiensis]|uniref:AAA family ATPase n=1 Tax=Quatrionicoccus australiensis TaxID=138118 RepID=UPI001CF88C08|nr:AAA family ATPase [Quatrionicoccus australiensis]UCV16612.1 AAA family ATPase [Quatrionicoccus australiensis]